jgi:hypothetical protein
MSDFATEFMKSMGPQVSSQLAGTLGLKKQQATQLIPQVLPLIMGGLKRQMDTQGGAERANHILNKYGSPTVLDGIGELFAAKAAEETADPRLGGLLGDAGVSAAGFLGGAAGGGLLGGGAAGGGDVLGGLLGGLTGRPPKRGR